MCRMKEGQSWLHARHGDFWQRGKGSGDIYRSGNTDVYLRKTGLDCTIKDDFASARNASSCTVVEINRQTWEISRIS